MKIYNYHPETSIYLSSNTADESPLEPGKFLIPAFATDIKPPTAKAGKVQVFANGKWSSEPDLRGQTYYDAGGQPVLVAQIGDPAAAGLTKNAPPPKLEDVQAARIGALMAEFQAVMAKPCTILWADDGRQATFQMDDNSRHRLSEAVNSMVIASPPDDFAWYDADNQPVPMNYADLVGLLRKMNEFHWRNFQQLQTAKQAVRDATSIAEVEAVQLSGVK